MPNPFTIPSRTIVGFLPRALGFAILALPPAVCGHGPTDHSVELVVSGNRLVADVTLGMDGIREILAAAGWSPDRIRSVTASRGPAARTPLPKDLAPRLLELTQGDQSLASTSAWSRSDGMEVSVHLEYPGARESLGIRATYLDALPFMSPGWISVRDPDGTELHVAALTHDAVETSVELPSAPVAGGTASPAPHGPAPVADRPTSGNDPETVVATGSPVVAASLGLMLLGALSAVLLHFRKPGRNPREISPP